MLIVPIKLWMRIMQLWGYVVARHNTLHNAIFDFCKRALLNPKLEAGTGLGHERRLTRPADIPIPNWSTSDKPAAIDVLITSPLKSSILSAAGVVARAAARQTEEVGVVAGAAARQVWLQVLQLGRCGCRCCS